MKSGIIKINGQIGSYTRPDGTFVKGVDLVDVISQVKAQGEVDNYNVIINSMGGLVNVGYDIHDYLRGLKKPITTIINKQSASIATVASLAGDKGSRLIIAGSEFFIHNPWITESGTADELAEVSANIKETEKDLVAFYADNTGITKEGIAPLMRDQTTLTPEEAVKLGFVDRIITAEEAKAYGIEVLATQAHKAFALLKNKNSNQMADLTELKNSIAEIAKKIGLKIKGAVQVVALDWKTTDTATEVHFETEADMPKEGDVASIAGTPAPDGTYNFEGDVVVTVAEGKVTSVTAATAEDTEALKAKIVQLESEKKALEEKNVANETAITALSEQVKEIGKHITTNYKPKAAQAQGNKGEQKKTTGEYDSAAYLAKRKAEIEARKNAKK